jgi:hypothetical protein
MMREANPLPLIERVEHALVLLALFIELDGDVHVPMYEKFEAELHDLTEREQTKDRARRRLSAYSNRTHDRRHALVNTAAIASGTINDGGALTR